MFTCWRVLFSLAVSLAVSWPALAIENRASWGSNYGGYTVSDTLLWKNSVSGTSRDARIDTLVGTADRDTSKAIPIAGASTIALQVWIKSAQGTAGDGALASPGSRVSIVPQFSNDGATWTDFVVDSVATGQGLAVNTAGVIFSSAASPHKTTASTKWYTLKPLTPTVVIADSVYNRLRTIPATARFMRLRNVGSEGSATDSTFLVTIYNLTFPK